MDDPNVRQKFHPGLTRGVSAESHAQIIPALVEDYSWSSWNFEAAKFWRTGGETSFWSCSMYSFIKLMIDPIYTTSSVLYVALPFFPPILTLSHCRHVTALCCLIWILFSWIKSHSYFVMPHVMHLHCTHSFFGRLCWTSFLKHDVTLSFFKCDVTLWCSVLKGDHVASITSEWFWGIPFIPKAINTSLVFPKFAQYSHLVPHKGVSWMVLTFFGFSRSNVFSTTILWCRHFFT